MRLQDFVEQDLKARAGIWMQMEALSDLPGLCIATGIGSGFRRCLSGVWHSHFASEDLSCRHKESPKL